MRRFLLLLWTCWAALGCARIYRPAPVTAPTPVPRGAPLAVQVLPQPWGDNSGYAAKARRNRLKLVVVGVQNTTTEPLDLQRVEGLPPVETLGPGAAMAQVRQPTWAFLLYPGLPLLASLGADASTHGGFLQGGELFSERAGFQMIAGVGLLIGVPNALVSAHSNRTLEAYLREHAFVPGPLAPGERRHGLLYLRPPAGAPPPVVVFRFRTPTGEGQVEAPCAEAPDR